MLDKTGDLFLYDRDHLGRAPQQQLRVADVGPGDVPLIGLPSFDSSSRKLVVLTPVDAPAGGPPRGLVAYRLSAACRLEYRWQHDFDPPSSGSQPMIARGVVYVGSGRSGWIRAFSIADGTALWSRHLGLSEFSAPAVLDGKVYAADWDGGVWSFRPQPAGNSASR